MSLIIRYLNRPYVLRAQQKLEIMVYGPYLQEQKSVSDIQKSSMDGYLFWKPVKTDLNSSHLAQMKKSIPDMSLPWNL